MRYFMCWAVFTLAATTSAHRSGAQELRFSAIQAWPNNDLLGTPRGVSVELGIQLRRWIGLRVGYEESSDHFRSFGSTCVGLVPPGLNCSNELRAEVARVRAFALSAPATLVTLNFLELKLLPGLRMAHVESDQVGTRSGRVRSARKSASGGQIGAEAVVLPVRTWPLRLHLGLHTVLLRHDDPNIVDGYTPLATDLKIDWIQIGLSLKR